jgi:hypothetical protein
VDTDRALILSASHLWRWFDETDQHHRSRSDAWRLPTPGAHISSDFFPNIISRSVSTTMRRTPPSVKANAWLWAVANGGYEGFMLVDDEPHLYDRHP